MNNIDNFEVDVSSYFNDNEASESLARFSSARVPGPMRCTGCHKSHRQSFPNTFMAHFENLSFP